MNTSNSGHIVPGSKGMNRAIDTAVEKASINPVDQINISDHELQQAVSLTRDRADMNEEIISMIPELKQGKEIINSSIVSPNDFSKKELLVDYNNTYFFSDTIVSKLKALGEYSRKKYNLVDDLYDICDNGLWLSGADAEIIIPRSKIEKLIGNSIDSLNKNPKASKVDLESFIKGVDTNKNTLDHIGKITLDTDTSISKKINKQDVEVSLKTFDVEFIGDPLILAANAIYDEKLKNSSVYEAYNLNDKIDTESIDPNILGVYDKYKKSARVQTIDLSAIDSKPNKADMPFRLKLNSSCVLPVYTNNKREHLFYLVVVDELHRAITNIPTDKDLYNGIRGYNATGDGTVIKQMVDRANENLNAGNDKSVVISNMLGIAESVLLNSVKKTIKNSIYRNTVNLDNENSLIRIILHRSLLNTKTNILFVPTEYMSYIAFDYRKNGTGKTLLEDITVLASFKAMLTLSEIYSAIDNNIPSTDVKVVIDDDDPEPEKTKEKIEQSIYNSNRKMLWGETSLERHGLFIQNSTLRVFFEHKTFPNTTMNIERKNKETAYTPDTTASDKVTSMILKSIGLSPTILNEAENIEFASVASISNALTNKINNTRQDILSEGVSDRNLKLMLSDASILKTAFDILESNKASIIKNINESIEDEKLRITEIPEFLKLEIVKDMLSGISLRLPRAESKDNIELREKFKGYVDSVDDVMKIYTDSSFIGDAASELGITIDTLVANIKLIHIMAWCEEHNYATTMSRFMNLKDTKELKRIMDMINQKDANMIDLAKSISKQKNKILERITEQTTEPTDDTTTDNPIDTTTAADNDITSDTTIDSTVEDNPVEEATDEETKK